MLPRFGTNGIDKDKISGAVQQALEKSEKALTETQTKEANLQKQMCARRNGKDLDITRSLVSSVVKDQAAVLSLLKEVYGNPGAHFTCKRSQKAFLKELEELLCKSCLEKLVTGTLDQEMSNCFRKNLEARGLVNQSETKFRQEIDLKS